MALGSGAAKGWAHIGVMRALEDAKGLRHPNVVPILEVASVSDRDLIVSERITGETFHLRKLAEERPVALIFGSYT